MHRHGRRTEQPELPDGKGQHHRRRHVHIAVGEQPEAAQPHEVLHLRDEIPHGALQPLGHGLHQLGVAQQTVVAEGEMLRRLQTAQLIQRAVPESVQSLVCEMPFRIKQLFIVKKQAHSFCLLSVICWRSSALARNSWLCTVAGGRCSSAASWATVLPSSKYPTATGP